MVQTSQGKLILGSNRIKIFLAPTAFLIPDRDPDTILEHQNEIDVNKGGFFVRKKSLLTLDDLLASVPHNHKEELAFDDEPKGREIF